MRAITLDDPGVTDMDLDLELNLTDADWLTAECVPLSLVTYSVS